MTTRLSHDPIDRLISGSMKGKRPSGNVCPDAEQLAELADDVLSLQERDELERHIASCSRCIQIIEAAISEEPRPFAAPLLPHAENKSLRDTQLTMGEASDFGLARYSGRRFPGPIRNEAPQTIGMFSHPRRWVLAAVIVAAITVLLLLLMNASAN